MPELKSAIVFGSVGFQQDRNMGHPSDNPSITFMYNNIDSIEYATVYYSGKIDR